MVGTSQSDTLESAVRSVDILAQLTTWLWPCGTCPFFGVIGKHIYSNTYNDMMNLLVMACEWDCKYFIKIYYKNY